MANRQNRQSPAYAAVPPEYMPRPRGLTINWSALGVIATLVGAIISFVWLAATQNAAIATNHTIETTTIAANQASIVQLQANEKENDKQRVEVLLHLQSIDQTLREWSYGAPRGAQVLMPAQPANTSPTFNIEAAPRQTQFPSSDGNSTPR